ncbi:MAG: hypothetical protein V7749_00655 [Cocleimonas sp.]
MNKLTLTKVNTTLLTLLLAVSAGTASSVINNNEKTVELETSVDRLNQKINAQRYSQDTLNGYIELASNNRMSSLVSYHINRGYSIKKLADNGYLNALSSAFKQDYIDDNLYSRMNSYNTQVEFQNLSSSETLIREKWIAHIESGSHFDIRPQGRLILSSESIDIPVCSPETKPYLAYAIAYPPTDKNRDLAVDIKEERSQSGVQQYRFVLKQKGTLTPFNTTHRILIDVGCVNVDADIEGQLTDETELNEMSN